MTYQINENNYKFKNLDNITRQIMMEEVEHDQKMGQIYKSTHFNRKGHNEYEIKLINAVQLGNEKSLQDSLNGCFEDKKYKTDAANRRFSNGQFNHYYMRAIAVRAIKQGQQAVTVYRAYESKNQKQESNDQIERKICPKQFLAELRESNNSGFEKEVKMINIHPNGGLSVYL